MYLACFRVNQFWQAGFLGTFFNDLPRPVAVNAEDQPFPFFDNRSASLNLFLEHFQCFTIYWQNSLAAVFYISL